MTQRIPVISSLESGSCRCQDVEIIATTGTSRVPILAIPAGTFSNMYVHKNQPAAVETTPVKKRATQKFGVETLEHIEEMSEARLERAIYS